MAVVVSRFDIYLVQLDPTRGPEIQKTRPCLIISPDEMNRHIDTVIIAPMTTRGRPCPTRVPVRFKRKSGQIVLDQIRTVDRGRLVKRFGKVDQDTADKVLALLAEMFAA
ncbi:MAG TPA: type II toxin-antitoxin system PemK/MazF family toxin [Nitrospiraceae bacterium]|nr:type II toxin-antitoxin system PemK/MazF family toxin [Nitrospiraceae bacterium]